MKRIDAKFDMAAALVLLAAFLVWLFGVTWGTWSIDMSAVYMAGYLAATGQTDLIYSSPPLFFMNNDQPAWRAIIDPLGGAGEKVTVFVYPPIWAYVAAPLAERLGPIAFFDATRVVMYLSYAGSILLTWRLMAPRVPATVFVVVVLAASVVTIPFTVAAILNQPQLLLVFLILLAFERYVAGRPVLAGVLLGLVAAVKITPVLLALVFAADRQWRAVAACLATAFMIMLASFAVAGVELHLDFLRQVRRFESLVPFLGLNATFETVMHNFFVPITQHAVPQGGPVADDTPWVSGLSRVLLVASVIAAIRVTRHLDLGERTALRLLLAYTAIIFFGPIAWMHYYMLPLLLMLGLPRVWNSWRWALAALAVVVGFMDKVVMTFFFKTESGEWPIGIFAQHLALLPFVALLFLVIRNVILRRENDVQAVLGRPQFG